MTRIKLSKFETRNTQTKRSIWMGIAEFSASIDDEITLTQCLLVRATDGRVSVWATACHLAPDLRRQVVDAAARAYEAMTGEDLERVQPPMVDEGKRTTSRTYTLAAFS